MSFDPDKLWKHVAGRLRKEEGLCLPTPDEAQAEYEKTVPVILSKERMEEIFMFATSDDIPNLGSDEEEATPWASVALPTGVEEEEAALCHNEGEADPEAERLERELQEKMLWEEKERGKKR
ncbi:MAG: hypothetical protein AAB288_09030 [Acidobacteriota bacterium]